MNARRVNAAAGVICAAQKTKQTPTGIAAALEAACLLQSPETAAEVMALRERVAELETALAEATEPDVDGAGRTYEEFHPGIPPCAFKNPHEAHTNRPGQPTEYRCPGVPRAVRTEDPHDSPLHHTYATPRDLPEVTW